MITLVRCSDELFIHLTVSLKKWVSTAHSVTASSGPIGKSIEKLTGVKSAPLFNGIAFEDLTW